VLGEAQIIDGVLVERLNVTWERVGLHVARLTTKGRPPKPTLAGHARGYSAAFARSYASVLVVNGPAAAV
jgi:hypothetical protein